MTPTPQRAHSDAGMTCDHCVAITGDVVRAAVAEAGHEVVA